MAQIDLIPSGKLDRDSDLNALKEGDYSDARNVIYGTGKSGGRGTLKILESIKILPITQTLGTLKATLLASDNTIYALYRTDGTNASIYKIPSTLDSKALVLTYAHAATVDFVPDLKMIGNTLVWNYHGVGTLLYWDVTPTAVRPQGVTVLIENLLHAKPAPINVIGVSKTITSGVGSDFLEFNDFQFSSRYKYDTGEFSVLGNFSPMFKGQKDTSSYTISFTLTQKPIYAEEIEVYMRRTEIGVWFRIHTANITSGTLASIVWKGDYYETLASEESDVPFSAVPVNVKNIEIVADRIVVADFEDDYTNDATGTLEINVNNGYTLPTGGTIKNYFGGDTTDAGIKSAENGTYYKPLANNSPYTVAVAFMDSAMKTRGYEYSKTFNTGTFAAPFNPTFSLSQSGNAKPSWAKWMQLILTKNLAKGRIFEGFANTMYFELEIEETNPSTNAVTKVLRNKLSVTNADSSKIKYCILDISGMFNAGLVYAYNPGDRITLNCPNGTVATTDPDGSETGAYRRLDLEVKSSTGDKVYLEWSGGACLNDAIPDATKLFFEIYSPRQQSEEDKTFAYAVGPAIDISGGIPSTITDYTIGDMVFKKFEMNTYTDQLLYKGLTRSVPAEILANATTIFKSNKDSSSTSTIITTAVSNSKTPLIGKKDVVFTVMGPTNQDVATVTQGLPQMKGFYDSRCKITVTFDYTMTRTIGSNPGPDAGTARFIIRAYLAKVPYDPVLNTYGAEVMIGTKRDIHSSDVDSSSLNSSEDLFTTKTLEFDLTNVNAGTNGQLSSGDRIKVYFEVSVGCSTTDMVGVSLVLKEKAGVTESCTVTVIGDRIAPVVSYSSRNSIPTSVNKTSFVVRAMGHNNTTQWSTGGGKVFVKAQNKFTPRRTNAVRHSGNMVYGTSVNNISMFSVLDTVEVPQENGPVMSLQRASRLQGEGDMLLAICRNETSYMLLGEVNSSQSDNSGFSSITTGVFGTVRNLGEKTGIEDRSSVYNHNGTIYWWDNFRNIVVQFTKKGTLKLSDNGMRSDFANKTGVAKFAYDPFHDLLLVKIGSTVTCGYNVESDQWKADFDVNFDMALHFGERAVYFNSGYLYRSLENASGNKVGEYMGTSFPAYVKMTVNTVTPIMPLNIMINHNMNVINYGNANYVKSGLMDINITNENAQETNIKEVNFLLEDNKLYAHIMRDINSVGGLVGGREIRGGTNNFKLNLKDNSQENRIFGLILTFDKVTGHK
jgi:hypothetical protein